MDLPIDIKALIDEMTNITSARNTEISLSVYLDERAPSDIVAFVRGMFASSASTVRMTLSYLDTSFAPHAGDDMAVIVAGASRGIGAAAAAIRAAGVPVAVVTTQPMAVERTAQERGYAIPEGDLIAPIAVDGDIEPFQLSEKYEVALTERMGEWIASVCGDKRVAFSVAFPFMRKSLAIDSVRATSLQNAGIGLIPLVPGADLPILTLNQAKMVLQIAAAYGHDMNKDRAKELAAVVGGAYLCRTLARGLVEFIPVLGFVFRTGIAYGGTSAIGYAVIDYYEGGEDAPGVANAASKATQRITKIATTVRENPQVIVTETASRAKRVVPAVRGKVEEIVPVARDLVSGYKPIVKEAADEYIPKIQRMINAAVRSK